MDRKKNSRKGENGRALIIGGSEDFVGALTLAGLGALRSGCDIVTIAAQDKVAWTVNRYAPDLITKKIKGNLILKSLLQLLLKLMMMFKKKRNWKKLSYVMSRQKFTQILKNHF